jgi:hypothetical protein
MAPLGYDLNKELRDACEKYDGLEDRGKFYYTALKLINSGFEIESYILLLAIWNTNNFRMAQTYDLDNFKKKLTLLDQYFKKLEDEHFKTIDFNKYESEIAFIFDELSEINFVKYTGAAKLMHLKNKHVFVMWDGYINGNGNHANADYARLDIVKRRLFTPKKYSKDGEGYLLFLKDMQYTFRDVVWDNEKPLAKAIDEFNYVNITLPIQAEEKRRREASKKQLSKK